jgi:hypothetical protein
MMRRLSLSVVSAAVLAVTTLATNPVTTGATPEERWVATWSTALHAPAAGPPGLTNPGFTNRTLRQVVRTSVSLWPAAEGSTAPR